MHSKIENTTKPLIMGPVLPVTCRSIAHTSPCACIHPVNRQEWDGSILGWFTTLIGVGVSLSLDRLPRSLVFHNLGLFKSRAATPSIWTVHERAHQ